MTLLLRYLPWLIGAAAIFGVGAWTGNALNPWHGRYQSLQVADAQARAEGEAAVRKAYQAQLAQAQATSRNNADSLVRLANENARITRDRDTNLALARRLLNGQARRPTPDSRVSQASNQPRAPPAGGSEGPSRIEVLLVDAGDESERCAHQLNALIAQLKPQL